MGSFGGDRPVSSRKTFPNTIFPLGLLLGIGAAIAMPVRSQVTPAQDGINTQVQTAGSEFVITGGQTSQDGENLFHSFGQFSVGTGEIANFVTPSTTVSVLGRIGGGSASVIDGTIQLTGSSADLYLLNPAGIVFGQNATLNVPASFGATTATGFGFGDDPLGQNQWFGVGAGNDVRDFTGELTALRFDGATGAIANFGNLLVTSGAKLWLVGGEALNRGSLLASQGVVTVVAVEGDQILSLSQPGSLLQFELESLGDVNPVLGGAIAPVTMAELLTGTEDLRSAEQATVLGSGASALTPALDLGSGETREVAFAPGTVVLSGSTNVSAPSAAGTEVGGSVAVSGSEITAFDGIVDARGTFGGGRALIGGDTVQEGSGLPPAQNLSMDSFQVATGSFQAGDGGVAVFSSEGLTSFSDVTVDATGGDNAGDGGRVEVFGSSIDLGGSSLEDFIDVDAPAGQPGNIIFDSSRIVDSSTDTADTDTTEDSSESSDQMVDDDATDDELADDESVDEEDGDVADNELTQPSDDDDLVGDDLTGDGEGAIAPDAIEDDEQDLSDDDSTEINNSLSQVDIEDPESEPSDIDEEGEGVAAALSIEEEGSAGINTGQLATRLDSSKSVSRGVGDDTAAYRQNLVGSLQSTINPEELVGRIEHLRAMEFGNYWETSYEVPVVEASLDSIQEVLRTVIQNPGKRSAILYTFAHREGLELVLVLPTGKPLRRTVDHVSSTELKRTVIQFRRRLTNRSLGSLPTTSTYLPASQKLYRWIVEPFRSVLDENAIDVIQFSLDPGLRSLPVAALHDGEQFLIENFAVAAIPSFTLLNSNYRPLERTTVLAAGTSQFETLPELPAVPVEAARIDAHWDTVDLLGEDFTLEQIRNARRTSDFAIAHFATHAFFEPGDREDSFIQLWGNERVGMDFITALNFQTPPLELLVLSACRTAVGDAQAELGFAGISVQSGAKSVVASLWQVSDSGTLALMSEFYSALSNLSTKAESLRQAQLAMLRGEVTIRNGQLQSVSQRAVPLPSAIIENSQNIDFTHPYFWSGFTLIGSPW
ncbi:MAG: CHAT domain-containing protein [Cyanophyceae cyanobacterium]